MTRTPTQEHTGWRDADFSDRHHKVYGYDCPAVDVDFLLCEYDRGQPYGLVDYKYAHRQEPNRTHPNFKALENLGDRAKIATFIAVYHRPQFWFRIWPVNSRSWAIFRKDNLILTEREYVERLYFLRNRELPGEVAAKLNDWKPSTRAEELVRQPSFEEIARFGG